MNNNNLKLIFQQNEKTYAVLITAVFFFFAVYAAMFHHPYFAEDDGMFYMRMGEEILKGRAQDIKISDAPPGGPIFYAFIDQFINDDFLTLKLVAIISTTGIVFVSYCIIKNIFNSKIAIISQLLVATNTNIFYFSYSALNESVPLLLIFISLYFITKQKFSIYDLIISGTVLGIAASFRFQSLLVLITIIIFLIVRNKKIKKNSGQVIIYAIFFILALSPILIFNVTTYGKIFDANSNEHVLWHWKNQPTEWRESVEKMIVTRDDRSVIFLDFDLFLENYVYSFFYNNPNKLFNFNTTNTISIFPVVPFLGIITFSIGYIYTFNFQVSKRKIAYIAISTGIVLLIIYQIGDTIEIFSALFFVPLLVIGIMNFKKIQENLLLMMILPLVFLTIISITNISRAYQLFPIWLIIPALNAVFFVEIIPKILNCLKIHNNQKKIVSIIIGIVIISNIGATTVFSYIMLYPHEFNGIINEIEVIIAKESFDPQGYQRKIVGEMLSNEKDIKTSYIMAGAAGYSYHAGSKWIIASFTEGKRGDSIQSYINRENWSDYDLYLSNIGSNPPDSNNIIKPTPDYIIYEKIRDIDVEPHRINSTQYQDLKILLEPDHPKIPSNFEMIWKSNDNDTIVYRINK